MKFSANSCHASMERPTPPLRVDPLADARHARLRPSLRDGSRPRANNKVEQAPRVHFAPLAPQQHRAHPILARPLTWQAACDEDRYFRARSKVINLASYSVLAAAVAALGQHRGPLSIVATLVACGVVANCWLRTDPQTNALEGFARLAQHDAAAAERAFGYAGTTNAGTLGLAEARRRQGKWAEAAYPLLRLRDVEHRHRHVVDALVHAIENRYAEPLPSCFLWL